jgi:hypothetical protein
MLKQVLVFAAGVAMPAMVFASDFRTLSHGGSPARSAQVNIEEMDRRVAEPPYALTGKKDREESRARPHFNWQAGSEYFRPGK